MSEPRRAAEELPAEVAEDLPVEGVQLSDVTVDGAAVQGNVVVTPAPTLPQVAAKRAWQTALQGLVIDVGVAVAVLLLASIDRLTSREALAAFAITIGKTVVSTAAAWVIRRYRDRAGFEAA